MNKIKSLLIFPPGWPPYSPYLALPSLKGFLDEKGINVRIKDFNLDFFYFILKDKNISFSKDEDSEIDRAIKLIQSDKYHLSDTRKEVSDIFHERFEEIKLFFGLESFSFEKIEFKNNINDFSRILPLIDDENLNPFIRYFKKEVIPFVNKGKFQFIGLSIVENIQIVSSLTLVSLIRRYCPSVNYITWGGNYITRIHRNWHTLNDCPLFYFIDSIIVNEGEKPLFDLIQNLSSGDNKLESIPNIIFLDNQRIVKAPIRIETSPLSKPNFKGYFSQKYFSPNLIIPYKISQGCFNKCSFCTISDTTSGSYRIKKMEAVIKDLIHLKNEFNTDLFFFTDEAIPHDFIYKISEIIIKLNLKINWYFETRFSPKINSDFCKVLFMAGCRKIHFGLESYNQRILDLMNKNIKIEWILPTIKNCLENNISVHLFVMFGFPSETLSESIRSFDFASSILKISKDKYGLCFSTFGKGFFSLEEGSALYNNPTKYSISILPNTNEPLKTSYNFRSFKDGLSEEEKLTLQYLTYTIPEETLKKHKIYHKKIIFSDEHCFNSIVQCQNLNQYDQVAINEHKKVFFDEEKTLPNPLTKIQILHHDDNYNFALDENGRLFKIKKNKTIVTV